MKNEITYEDLVSNVEKAHNMTSTYAKGAVNQLLTVRNWIIGYYIVEFEQNGKDRAEYGAKLLAKLSTNLNIKGLDRTALNLCRIFYQKYPQICETVSHKFEIPPEILISRLSFSHIREIMQIEDSFERFFFAPKRGQRWLNMICPEWTSSQFLYKLIYLSFLVYS